MKCVVSSHALFIPILKALVPKVEMFLTLHPPFAKTLQDLDLKAQPLAELFSVPMRERAWKESARILGIVAGLQSPANGIGPAPLQFMRQEIAAYLYPRIGDLAALALCLEEVKPDLVLLHNDVEPLTRVAAMWAAAHGTPCLHVPHAVYIDNAWRAKPGTDIHDVVTSSHIAAAGPYQRAWYEARAKNVKIRETGLPQFDRWAHELPVNRSWAKQLLGLSPDRPIVLYASSWRQDTNLLGCHDGVEEGFTAFLKMAQSLPQFQYIIKLHPNGAGAEWHVKQAEQANIQGVISAQHLEVCLQAADAAIAYGPSNLLIEASFLNHLRLLCIEGFADDPQITTLKPEASMMGPLLQNILARPPVDASAFRQKYAGVGDGKASERVVEWIGEIIA